MKEKTYFQFDFETTLAEQTGTYDLNKSKKSLILFFGIALLLLINVPLIIIFILWKINTFTLLIIAFYVFINIGMLFVFYRRKIILKKQHKIDHTKQFIKASFKADFFIYEISKEGFHSTSKIDWKNIDGFTILKDWVLLAMENAAYILKIKDWNPSQKKELNDFLTEKIKQVKTFKVL